MAKLPLFIPNRIKRELRDMGLNETAIKYMKPEEAWEIIEGRLSINKYVLNKINDFFIPKLQEELEHIESLPKKDSEEIKQENMKKEFMNKLINDNFTIN